MKTLELKLQRSYYYRMAFMTALTGSLSLLLAYFGLKHRMWPMVLFGLLPFGSWALLAIHEYRRGAKTLDAEGVTRRDGKRFLWAELQDIKYVYWRLQSGQQGALNHAELHFRHGKSRLFPLVLENGWEAVEWVERLDAQRKAVASAEAAPTPTEPAAAPTETVPIRKPVKPREQCSICSQLADFHYALQKHGREDEDTFLPKAVAGLRMVRELEPGNARSPELLQCPECGTYYLFEVEYEYLATGSEDEQRLTRLSAEEAAQYLNAT